MYLKKVFALLFAFTLVCCCAVAQTTPPPRSHRPLDRPHAQRSAVAPGSATSAPDDTLPVQTFHSRSDEVNVIFTVTDKHNRFIKDLKENQFKFLDNNQPPKQIMNFSAETDLPLARGLVD